MTGQLILFLDHSTSMSKVYSACVRACADAATHTRKTEVICYLFSTRLLCLYRGPSGRGAGDKIVAEGHKQPCKGKTAYHDLLACVLGKHRDGAEGTTLVIATDGVDNASRFVDGPDCTLRLLKAQKQWGWDVTFIGLNHPAGSGRAALIRSATVSGVVRPATICASVEELSASVRQASGCTEPLYTSSSCRTSSHEVSPGSRPELSRCATVGGSSTNRGGGFRKLAARKRHASASRISAAEGSSNIGG